MPRSYLRNLKKDYCTAIITTTELPSENNPDETFDQQIMANYLKACRVMNENPVPVGENNNVTSFEKEIGKELEVFSSVRSRIDK